MELHRPRRTLALIGLLVMSAPASSKTGSDDDWYWVDQDSGGLYAWGGLATAGSSALSISSASGSATVSLPFSFPYYGSTYSSITVFAYGAVVPGASASGPGPWSTGNCLANGSVSGPLIAPYWGTWDPSLGGTISAKTFDQGVLIEWSGVYASAADTSDSSFALLLQENGEISFLYKDTRSGQIKTSRGRGDSIGLQDSAGARLRFNCDVEVLTNFNNVRALAPWGTRQLEGTGDVDTLAAATLKGAAAGDRFGYAMATLGDLDGDDAAELLVSAPYADDGASNAGAVYLFSGADLSGDVSASAAVATLVGSGASDTIGTALAANGDVDGDGLPDLLVGAPNDEVGSATNAGTASLFFGSSLSVGGSLSLSAADAVFSGEAAGDAAGTSVSIGGDVNGDGYADLLIGAPNADQASTDNGQAYIVFGDPALSDLDLSIADVSWYGESGSDGMGAAVAIFGDADADGYDDFSLGAPTRDAFGADAGAVYVLFGDSLLTGTKALTSAIEIPGPAASSGLGSLISPLGDLDGDGDEDLFFAAPEAGTGANGLAYAALGGSTGWPAAASSSHLVFTGDGADRAGSAGVALDMDGAGDRALAIGAYGNSSAATNGGGVYVVAASVAAAGGNLSPVSAQGFFTSSEASAYLGRALAGGDYTGDGRDDLAAGAYGADGDAASAGAVYLLANQPTFPDADGDGWLGTTNGGLDCDDADATLNPATVELCDGVDDNCDGVADDGFTDTDGDGTADCVDVEECDGDDNDGDGAIDEAMPDTDGDGTCDGLDVEECDGLDNDGDGRIDDGFGDGDRDGIADCLDVEECDGYDNDGDGTTDAGYPDADGDGRADCVDAETCDGLDNDGDGSIDEDYEDTDRDGTADCLDRESCDGLDNDGDGTVDEDMPDTDGDGTCDAIDTELCDGVDNDGDMAIDEGFIDADGDGLADCVDGEDCDGIDNNGDGDIDEGYPDVDGDTVADCVDAEECDGVDNDGDGVVDEGNGDADFDEVADCMDAEECDGIDNNGDGLIDDTYPDADGDGVADCVDAEECDGVDNDGDGESDEGMLDSDGDGSADCVDDSPLPLPAEPEGETKGGGGCASTPGSGSALLGLLALLGLRRRAGVR